MKRWKNTWVKTILEKLTFPTDVLDDMHKRIVYKDIFDYIEN